MKEEFVSYTQARLLKECGFDWKCNRYYSKGDAADGTVWEYPNPTYENFNDGSFGSNSVSAPTLALAQKWLREVHGLHITIEPVMGDKWTYEVVDLHIKQDMSGEWYSPRVKERDGYPSLDSYESALSAGLDAAIELIKQK